MFEDIREYGSGTANDLNIQIIAFETEYVEKTIDDVVRQVPREKVILGRIGDPQFRQEHWIGRLSGERCASPVIWRAIKPAYEAWKKGEEIVEDGTPLAAVPFINKKAVDAYRQMNIRTVEHLSKVEDGDLQRMPLDARKHRDMARKYLEVQGSETTKLARKAQEQDDTISTLQAKLAEMEKMVDVKTQPRRPACPC